MGCEGRHEGRKGGMWKKEERKVCEGRKEGRDVKKGM